MKTDETATLRKKAFESPKAEIIVIPLSTFLMVSNDSPQNENTNEEDLF